MKLSNSIKAIGLLAILAGVLYYFRKYFTTQGSTGSANPPAKTGTLQDNQAIVEVPYNSAVENIQLGESPEQIAQAEQKKGKWQLFKDKNFGGKSSGNPFELSFSNINPVTHTMNWINLAKRIFKKRK